MRAQLLFGAVNVVICFALENLLNSPGLAVEITPSLLPVGRVVNLSITGSRNVFADDGTLNNTQYVLGLSRPGVEPVSTTGNLSLARACAVKAPATLLCLAQCSNPGRVLAELLLVNTKNTSQKPILLTSFLLKAYAPPEVTSVLPTQFPLAGGDKLRVGFKNVVAGLSTVNGGVASALLRISCKVLSVDASVELEASGQAVIGRTPPLDGCDQNETVVTSLALDGQHFEVMTGFQIRTFVKPKLKIGFILVGNQDDFGWNFQHNVARLSLENRFYGLIETETVPSVHEWGPNECQSCSKSSDWNNITENWNNAPPTFRASHTCVNIIEAWIKRGFSMFFATSYWYQWDTYALASYYPHHYFVHVTGWLARPNMANLFTKVHQARYLCGIVLGWHFKNNPHLKKRVGFISSFPLGETASAINALKLGLEQVDPKVEVLVVFMMSWSDARKEKLVAQRLIDLYGCEAIAQHTDSTIPQLFARSRGKVGVGYNADMLYTVGDSVLTSAILKWSNLYEGLVAKVLDNNTDNFGQVLWPGVENDGWRLSEFSPVVAEEAKIQVARELAKLQAGQDEIFCRPMLRDNKGRVRNNPNLPDPTVNPVPWETPPWSLGTTCLTDNAVKSSCQAYDASGNCVENWFLEGVWTDCNPSHINPDGMKSPKLTNSTCLLGNLDLPDTCPPGQILTIMGCEPTLPGSYAVSESAVPCPVGYAAAQSGMTACMLCQAGYFAGNLSSISCTACPPGRFSDVAGSGTCKPCYEGSFTASNASKECQLCVAGRFSAVKGQTTCDLCSAVLQGSSSTGGASTSDACLCPAGTFNKKAVCESCPDGLHCLGGTERPRQQAGYWAEDLGNLLFSVYHCRNKNECPAGTAENPTAYCATGRVGIACNRCKPGWTKGNTGTCQVCNRQTNVTFGLVAGATFLCGCLLVIFLRTDLTTMNLTHFQIVLLAGQVLTAVQALGAIKNLHITWVDPIGSILNGISSIITFDFEILSVSCFLGQDDTVLKFVLKLLFYPFVALSFYSVYIVLKLLGKSPNFDALFNLNGMALSTLYMSLTFTVLLPFQCVSNPNGTQSMLTEPGLVCWNSNQHSTLVTLASFGILLYPVTIYVWAAWITYTYPFRIASGKGLELVMRYRFLFSRFKPEYYYYSILHMGRAFFVALAPVILVGIPAFQIVALGFVILVGVVVQAWIKPWITRSANIFDVLISISLLLMLLGIGPLIDISNADKEGVVGVLVTVTLFTGLTATLCVLGWTIMKRFRNQKLYDVFLCHHKVAAGVLCRFIKMTLEHFSDGRVFLDSDDLEGLDFLFDHVKSQSKNLVVVLTSEVLTRMWCAGEIVSAHRNQVCIVPVICDGYQQPDPTILASIPGYWTEEQTQVLANFGITMPMVLEAYEYMIGLPAVMLVRLVSLQSCEDSILQVLRRCEMSRKILPKIENGASAPRILIVGSTFDAEAWSTILIVKSVLQQLVRVETAAVRTEQEMKEMKHRAVYLVVILSKGVLNDPVFAGIVLSSHLDGRCLEIVTAAEEGFEFPSQSFYDEAEQKGFGHLDRQLTSKLLTGYKSMLSVLALPLSPRGSHALIQVQVSEIARRFRKYSNYEAIVATHSLVDDYSSKNSSLERELLGGLVVQPSDDLVVESLEEHVLQPSAINGKHPDKELGATEDRFHNIHVPFS